MDLTELHPNTQYLMRALVPNPRLPDDVKIIAAQIYESAASVVAIVPEGPDLSAGLRKLVEAKDCFIRQALDAEGKLGRTE